MIELKIPTSAASMLLTERMQYELEMRAEAGFYYTNIELTDLNFKDLIDIAEVAAFDLVYMLPAEIFNEKNNLSEIIGKSIKLLSKKFEYREFENYSKEDAEKLIKPIFKLFSNNEIEKKCLTN